MIFRLSYLLFDEDEIRSVEGLDASARKGRSGADPDRDDSCVGARCPAISDGGAGEEGQSQHRTRRSFHRESLASSTHRSSMNHTGWARPGLLRPLMRRWTTQFSTLGYKNVTGTSAWKISASSP